MTINFRNTIWKFSQNTKQEFAMEVTCIVQTEDKIVTADPGKFESRLQEHDPREEERPACKLTQEPSSGCPPGWEGWFIGKPHRAQTKFSSDLEDQSKDNGMKMQMVVSVYMVERKSRVTEGLKLRADFCLQLWTQV